MLASALAFLNNEVKPKAHLIDRDTDAMREAFDRMAELGLLALKRPARYGGPDIPEAEFREFQEEVARVSGALAFLQTQHQSAVSLIAKHGDDRIRDLYLPGMHDGTYTVGLGFSQLRRVGDPICKATEVEGGYQISGHVPWVTGLGYFKEYLIGASLPDGQAVFGLVPLSAVEGQTISPPMHLAAMETAQTVTADLSTYFLPSEKVAFVKAPDWIKANDAFNIVLQGHFAIGCAMAGIDVVRFNQTARKLDFLAEYADQLEHELSECRTALVEAQRDTSEASAPMRLERRAWAIDVMMRCAHAAVTSSSGGANGADHPAQRVLREAIVFTVSAQTQPIMRATLDKLVR